MSHAPAIHVSRIQHGAFPDATAHNPKLTARTPLILVTLDILWEPDDARSKVARLEESLLAFSPRFRDHDCRGPAAYHVFERDGNAPAHESAPYEGRTALAHLIEHAMIEFQCAITGQPQCSGITAAYSSPAGRFDLMVESGTLCIGRCALALALSFVTSTLEGRWLGAEEREMVEAARLAYSRSGRMLTPQTVAGALAWSEPRASRALAALRDLGCLIELRRPIHPGGVPRYMFCQT